MDEPARTARDVTLQSTERGVGNLYESLDEVQRQKMTSHPARVGDIPHFVQHRRTSSRKQWFLYFILLAVSVTTLIFTAILYFHFLPQKFAISNGLLKRLLEQLDLKNKLNITTKTDKSEKDAYSTTTTDSFTTNAITANNLTVTNGSTSKNLQKSSSCWSVAGGNRSGVYTITVRGQPVQVYCDMSTAGGGWTLIQRRYDGAVNFYRSWDEYKHGFGNAHTEYWLGNDVIHKLTNDEPHELRIDMWNSTGAHRWAHYGLFSLTGEDMNYNLSLGEYTGTAGDTPGLAQGFRSFHNGLPFTTRDRDNDPLRGNCGARRYGGWWYRYCAAVHLNGLHDNPLTLDNPEAGIYWTQWTGNRNGTLIRRTEMKIRPVIFVKWYKYCAQVNLNGLYDNPLVETNYEGGIVWREWTGQNGRLIHRTEMKIRTTEKGEKHHVTPSK